MEQPNGSPLLMESSPSLWTRLPSGTEGPPAPRPPEPKPHGSQSGVGSTPHQSQARALPPAMLGAPRLKGSPPKAGGAGGLESWAPPPVQGSPIRSGRASTEAPARGHTAPKKDLNREPGGGLTGGLSPHSPDGGAAGGRATGAPSAHRKPAPGVCTKRQRCGEGGRDGRGHTSSLQGPVWAGGVGTGATPRSSAGQPGAVPPSNHTPPAPLLGSHLPITQLTDQRFHDYF